MKINKFTIICIVAVFLSMVFIVPKYVLALLPGCPSGVDCQGDAGTGENSNVAPPPSDGTATPPSDGSTGDPANPADTTSPGSTGDSSTSQGSENTLPPDKEGAQGSSSADAGNGGSTQGGGAASPGGQTPIIDSRPLLSVSGDTAEFDQCKNLGMVRFENDEDDDGLTLDQEQNYSTDPFDVDSDYDSYFDGAEVCAGYDPLEPPNIFPINLELQKKLKGYIILQTERRGEAWYMYPADGLRYYLRNGGVAYKVMRFLSLGITNVDLAKIPVGVDERSFISDIDGDGKFPLSEENLGLDIDRDSDGLPDKMEEGLKTDPLDSDSDGDGVSDGDEVLIKNSNPLGEGNISYDQKIIKRLKGKIVLQVESRGEAWYIHPVDGKRYYMKDGNAAYQIMRFLSLGITNNNINQLPIGTLRGKIR